MPVFPTRHSLPHIGRFKQFAFRRDVASEHQAIALVAHRAVSHIDGMTTDVPDLAPAYGKGDFVSSRFPDFRKAYATMLQALAGNLPRGISR